ncbi:MAG: nucleoside deaminase [Patescibacteria group bacterium]|jgi:guanine deaminase
MTKQQKFMNLAITEAKRGVLANHGGPFGAVIVRKQARQQIAIAQNHNQVIKTNDPTAHAEMLAIRAAAKRLRRFDLSDCALYSSCEPCPMCLAAIYWAGIKTVYYSCTKQDAAGLGFKDQTIYQQIASATNKTKNKKQLPLKLVPLARADGLAVFKLWYNKSDKVLY